MKKLDLTESAIHIINELILDAEQGIERGDSGALETSMFFKEILGLGFIPEVLLGNVYSHYLNQRKNLKDLTYPRIDKLKMEVRYMCNFLESNYEFQVFEDGIVAVEKE